MPEWRLTSTSCAPRPAVQAYCGAVLAGLSKPRLPRVAISPTAARTAHYAVAGQMVGACPPVIRVHVPSGLVLELRSIIVSMAELTAVWVIQDIIR